MADLDSLDPFAPPSYGWSPEQEQMFADAMAQAAAARAAPAPTGEVEMPADNFASVTPDDLARARQERLQEETPIAQALVGGVPWVGYPTNPDAPQPPAPLPPPDPNGWDPALTAAPEPPPAPAPPPELPAPTLGSVGGVPLSLVPTSPEQDLAAEAEKFASKDPFAQALDLQRFQDDTAEKLRAEQAKLEEQQARDAERSRDNHAKARMEARARFDRIDAEAARIAQTEINPDRYTQNMGALRTILTVVSAAAGGLVQHLNGGRNLGLEMLDKAIERDIAAQREAKAARLGELQRQSGVALDRMRMDEADAEAEDAYRAVVYQTAKNKIAREMQQYEQRGTTHMRLARSWQEITARQAQARIDGENRAAELIKNRLDLEGKALDNAKKRADAMLAEKKAAGFGMGGGGAGKPVDKQLSEADLRLMFPGAPDSVWEFVKAKGGAASPKEVAAQVERVRDVNMANKTGADASKAAREASPEEQAGQLAAGDLTTADGKPLLFRDTASATRIAKKREAVDNTARLIDQLIIARKKYGWSSDLFKSPEWRVAQADMGALIIQAKNDAELGALSGPDMGLVEKMLGTTDPTEVRDPLPGLEQARANSIANFNTTLRAEARPGQKPKPYAPPKLEAAEAEERKVTDNLDVYDAPEIDAPNVDIEIRRRAAERAAKGVDALARQIKADPAGIDLIDLLLQKNVQRLNQGLLDASVAKQAEDALRKRRARIEKELSEKDFEKPKQLINSAYDSIGDTLSRGLR